MVLIHHFQTPWLHTSGIKQKNKQLLGFEVYLGNLLAPHHNSMEQHQVLTKTDETKPKSTPTPQYPSLVLKTVMWWSQVPQAPLTGGITTYLYNSCREFRPYIKWVILNQIESSCTHDQNVLLVMDIHTTANEQKHQWSHQSCLGHRDTISNF